MKDDLIKLYNTMNLVETKGENTKIMAQCLLFLENLIRKNEKDIKIENSIV